MIHTGIGHHPECVRAAHEGAAQHGTRKVSLQQSFQFLAAELDPKFE